MRRVIYLNPFSPENISGGIKTAYRHVEILRELGYDALVFQPGGPGAWLTSTAPVIQDLRAEHVREDDVLIFPEVLHIESLHPFLQLTNGCKKLLFCQNQFYAFNQFIPSSDYRSLGFDSVFCSSLAGKQFLENTVHVPDVTIVPCFVDRELFRPLRKKLQIFAVAAKLPDKAMFIAQCLRAKHHDARDVPLLFVRDRSEEEVARLMGESAIVLALGARESFGLVALEAMSAHCLVAGFHGYGGLEYANHSNGLWFWSDEEEAVADALYRLLTGLRKQEVWTRGMLVAGHATADRYSRERTREALRAYFRGLGVLPGMSAAVVL